MQRVADGDVVDEQDRVWRRLRQPPAGRARRARSARNTRHTTRQQNTRNAVRRQCLHSVHRVGPTNGQGVACGGEVGYLVIRFSLSHNIHARFRIHSINISRGHLRKVVKLEIFIYVKISGFEPLCGTDRYNILVFW